MANIRCPMCGRENPAELETCRYCQARLKPLIYSPPLGDESNNGFHGQSKPAHPERKEQIQDEEPTTKPLASRAGSDSGPANEAGAGGEDANLDWLSGLREQDAGESPEAGETNREGWKPVERWIFEEESLNEKGSSPGPKAPSVTDWLSSLDDRSDLGTGGEEGLNWEAGSGEDLSLDAEELPDWLKNLTAEEPALADSNELPEWLFESKNETESSEPEGETGRSTPTEPLKHDLEQAIEPGLDVGGIPEPDLPGFGRSKRGKTESEPGGSPPVEGFSEPEPVNTHSEEGSFGEDAFDVNSFAEIPFGEDSFDDELTEWLQQMEPLEDDARSEEEQDEETPAEDEPDLAPAEIPAWLAAMRPIEDAVQAQPARRDEDENPELAGPLSGLRGVLQVEPVSPERQINTSIPIKLQATADQRNHADLLAGLLEHAWEPLPARTVPGASSAEILRWGIALVLFLVILWPLVTGAHLSPPPSLGEAPLVVNQIIGQLPSKAHVLVAFDYQPARAGEMEGASEAVINQLVQMGDYLTLVSTNTSGPALAERFMQRLPQSSHIAYGEAYINLGYIPGGPVGLLSFVQSPQRTLPYTIEGKPAWSTGSHPGLPPLQGIQELRDFDLLLVIVDDPADGRYWIEQVGPGLKDEDFQTPMVMISSAQAEAMLLPYYHSSPRQVDGLMTGLRDGSGYAQLTGQPGAAQLSWDAFSAGLLVAVLVIVIGSVLYFLLAGTQRSEHVEGIL